MDARTTTALLYLDGVTVSFDGFRALNNLSFTIEPREMRAIIGPNGAGKTTMMDVITGKTRPDTGEVYFDGSYDLSRLDETEIALLGIGRKFQKPTVFDMHTVEDNIGLALKGDRRARKTLFWRETEEERSRINRILDTIRLSPVRHRVAGSLAHGQKQWLEIGMLLAQEPKLLLVDEPVAGMTDAETRQTAELLKEINRDRTVVVVEHDMTFVRELGVKVTCLHEGSVLAEGTIDQVSENERVVEVYLGRWRDVACQLDRSALRRGAGAAQRVALRRAGQGHLRAGTQRRRQDEPSRRARRTASGQQGYDHVRWRRHHLAQAQRARAARHRLRPAGARNLSAPHRRGEPQNRLCAAQARGSLDPRRRVRAVSGARRHVGTARRRSLRRPAAAARDRPGARHAPAPAVAGRTDRGYPAVDHQGHRPRHRLFAQSRTDRRGIGRALSRLCARAGGPFRGDGSRRDRLFLQPRHDGRGGAQTRDGDLSGPLCASSPAR